MEHLSYDAESGTLWIRGSLTREHISEYVREQRKLGSVDVRAIDVSGVEHIDNAGFGFLRWLQRELPPGGAELVALPEDLAQRQTLLRQKSVLSEQEMREEGWEEPAFGGATRAALRRFGRYLAVAADIIGWSVVEVFRPRYYRRGEVVEQCYRIGTLAVPVLVILSLVLGLILALQSAVQLGQIGADLFVADLLAIAVIREMAPMMTAILLAGRSGSAITSQIGTMKVTEEIDALRVMGIQPLRFIAVPMFLGGSIVMPFLVSVAIVSSAMGGVIAAVTILGLSPISFVDRLFAAISPGEVVTTYIKSEVFMWAIVTIASYYGLQVRGGAQQIGKATTSSVVASIFGVILIDVLFSLLALR